jgi:hypothetical protein
MSLFDSKVCKPTSFAFVRFIGEAIFTYKEITSLKSKISVVGDVVSKPNLTSNEIPHCNPLVDCFDSIIWPVHAR